jgi:hypothetical protein
MRLFKDIIKEVEAFDLVEAFDYTCEAFIKIKSFLLKLRGFFKVFDAFSRNRKFFSIIFRKMEAF